MALLGSFNKQPGETLDCDISYSAVLTGRTDTISTVTATVTPAGLTLVSTTLSNNICKFVVSGGTDTTLYKVTVKATSTAGLVYEDEVNVLVGEV